MIHQTIAKGVVFSNHKLHGGEFGKEITSQLETCSHLEIASGYFGNSIIESLKPKFLEIAKRGYCKILIGMIFNEGVSANQKKQLINLHNELKLINAESGIFLTLTQYHGKIYKIRNNELQRIYVGSSNLSQSGFYGNFEFNALIQDSPTQIEVSNFLDFLLSTKSGLSAALDEVELYVKGFKGITTTTVDENLSSYLIKPNHFPANQTNSSVKIKLRVNDQPNSSLNLYFDKGRKNKSGKYAPRPWYEVEITSTKEERNNQDYPIGDFDAYIKIDNNHYKLPMLTASDNYKAITSKNNRELLGELIKGRLENLGLLVRGERITLDTLNDYGKDYIELKKFDEKKYYLEF